MSFPLLHRKEDCIFFFWLKKGGVYSLFVFQHPMMPPYGTPVPYPAMYPPGGVYAHPSMVAV